MNRRDFAKIMIGMAGMTTTTTLLPSTAFAAVQKTKVALVKTTDRAGGTRKAMALLGINPARGNIVLLKPNFNSADPAPGSTHSDILRALITELENMGAKSITVADRSGMGNTRRVMEQLGIFALGKELGFTPLVFEELGQKDWAVVQNKDQHWSRGFALPKPVLNADCVVQACALKTHRFGGHFTLSLKNSVGLAAKTTPANPYNYMTELHSSKWQRHMIAEINAAYTPALIVMDGVEAFTTGGPDRGKLAKTEVMLASTDRIAIDAVGVAILRLFGTTPEVSKGRIFEQAQIARAVELGLGVAAPAQIEIVTGDESSAEYAKKLRPLLDA
jgi:uncharacterized protein (DUF362 family)